MWLGHPVIDIHSHLRNNIGYHTKIAKKSGIDIVVYMANTRPVMDSLLKIKKSLKAKRYCRAIPVSAITKNLAGEEMVDIEAIKPYVAGFSDDGKCLKNLDLLKEALRHRVLIMLHCEPESEWVEKYLKLLEKVGGRLHLQHISKKESVDLIRRAKRKGIKITCETCPHYFTYTKDDLSAEVNPPLGSSQDILAIKKGLADGTIDIIASDYAPLPRKTGIAGFRSFIPLSYGLVLEGVLTKKQLKEKLYLNPQALIKR